MNTQKHVKKEKMSSKLVILKKLVNIKTVLKSRLHYVYE